MKTRFTIRFAAALLLLSTINFPLSTIFAQGTTAFTYQGQLRDNGTNANGAYTMTFKLYDAANGGDQIGGNVTTSPTLANGLFTVSLDFGPGAFNSGARWLDITVQSGSDSEELAPRVQVLPSPYAQFAAIAATVTNGAIMNAQLAANAVAAGNIQSGAVTDAKIVSVSGGKVTGTVASATDATLFDGLSTNDFTPIDDFYNLLDDLTNNYATLDHLTNYATLDDLTNYATLEDLTLASSIPQMQVLGTPGATLFVVPTNVTRVMVEVWGGGGGGGTGAGDGLTAQGGGGGGGGYGKGVYHVTAGTGYTVVVGSGGGSDSQGQASSFGSLISAGGGSHGTLDPLLGTVDGSGGGSSAIFNVSGSPGNDGAGGSAGACGGLGGGIIYQDEPGEPGSAPGGGGSGGGFSSSGGTVYAGGSGGSGRVVIYY